MTRKIKLVLEYDGTAFHGWQIQKNATSVQQNLSNAIALVTGETVVPEGAGRTDAGVHAKGQVAAFYTDSSIPDDRFAYALNAKLPPSISVIRSEVVDIDFHPRKSAKSKWYRYQIFQSAQRSALLTNRAWHVSHKLNFQAMQNAAKVIEGTHDFHAFCAAGSSVQTFERTILSAKWSMIQDMLCFDIVGTGFLYHMVRILVGTMVEMGKEKRAIENFHDLLMNGDRTQSGITAPPEGLYLMDVYY